jgi:hypothetical protein
LGEGADFLELERWEVAGPRVPEASNTGPIRNVHKLTTAIHRNSMMHVRRATQPGRCAAVS